MTKRTIKETVREYNEKGDLIKETITETVEDDDTQYVPYYPTTAPQYVPYWDNGITCSNCASPASAQSE